MNPNQTNSPRPRRIRIIAPSGIPDATSVETAIARLRAQGHHVDGEAAALRRYQRFAGIDAERLADLNQLADPAIALPDIALAARGGYGAVRLLAQLDYDGLRARLSAQPVALVGYSDFTAVQMALLARAGLITFSGPTLGCFGAPMPSEFTLSNFWRTLESPRLAIEGLTVTACGAAYAVGSAPIEGTLWGGNLAVLASLVGTPYLPAIDGGILFIEDVNERPFRIERMLYQLYLAGVLGRQKALVLGHFTNGEPHPPVDHGYDLHAALTQLGALVGIPILAGLPFGHVDDLLTLPVGAPARLAYDAAGKLELSAWGYPNFSGTGH